MSRVFVQVLEIFVKTGFATTFSNSVGRPKVTGALSEATWQSMMGDGDNNKSNLSITAKFYPLSTCYNKRLDGS